MRTTLWVLTLSALLGPMVAQAGQTTCPCVADASIASTGREADFNSGTAERIKIKGRENQLIMRFDLSDIPTDAVITSATLRMHTSDPIFRLNQVAVSSVSTDWTEGAGRQIDDEGEAAQTPGVCFNRPGGRINLWAGEGSTIADVTWGNGGSVENYTFAKPQADNWWHIEVDPRVIAAMRADSCGLIVQEESGWWTGPKSNIMVHSRENKKFAPTLTVTWADPDKTAPSPVRDIKVSTKDLDDGQVVLEFVAGGDDGHDGTALGYEIRCLPGEKINADNLAKTALAPRWQTPRPRPAGQTVKAWLTDLKPGTSYSFAVIAYDQSGNRSPIASTSVVKLPKNEAPRLAALKPIELPAGSPVQINGKMALWVTDELTKVDPVSGKILDGPGYVQSSARNGSHVWDGKTHTVRLTALRGEVVAFNLVVEALADQLADIHVKPGPLAGEGKEISADRFTLHRVWYVHQGQQQPRRRARQAPNNEPQTSEAARYYGDPTPILDKPLQIPAADNKVPGQTNQSVYVDLYVPHDAAAGTYRGALTVASSAGQGTVNIQLDVLPLQMPAELSYVIELNSYGCSNDRDRFLAMHRLAHLHRLGYNVLPYGHCESVTIPFMPRLQGEGASAKITDWTEFDRWMAPLLDGSAFADLPRGPVPIPHWYLPFHENYPGKIRKHYAKPEFFENEPKNADGLFDYNLWKDRIAAEDVDIRNAFSKVWHDEARAIGKQYRDHFIDKGWTRTQFQIFCNNKHYFREPKSQNVNEKGTWQYATSLWTLDEPSFGRDFRALGYIYGVFKEPLVGAPLNVVTRGDVSRPQWQGDRLDNLPNLIVVSSALYQYQSIIQSRRVLHGDKYWFYGGGLGPDGDNAGLEAVYIKTWTMGVDGGLAYWTSFQGADAWDTANPLAVVHLSGGKGYSGPVATTRLKAQRRAQQDIELMNLLARQPGWNRVRVARAIAAAINLKSDTKAEGADDPGQTSFQNIHAADLAKIRLALAREILAAPKTQASRR